MRKIEQEMLNAIAHHRNWKKSNTKVKIKDYLTEIYLFGNHIATIDGNTGYTYFCHCGYKTPTTRSRLRALGLDVHLHHGSMICKGENTTLFVLGFNPIVADASGRLIDAGTCFPVYVTREERIEKMKNCAAAQNKRRYRATLRQSKMWSRMLFT